jgi:transcription initiation factor TFIID subunit 3
MIKKMSPTNYARNVLRISIAQMLQTIGFQSAQSTALDILVEILERYIILISKSSHEYSELGNFFDNLFKRFKNFKMI